MTPSSPSPEPVRADGVQPVADLSGAPLPTSATLRRRRNPLVQMTRFIAFNLRILRMVGKGHR